MPVVIAATPRRPHVMIAAQNPPSMLCLRALLDVKKGTTEPRGLAARCQQAPPSLGSSSRGGAAAEGAQRRRSLLVVREVVGHRLE
jgi:hypothetical protein